MRYKEAILAGQAGGTMHAALIQLTIDAAQAQAAAKAFSNEILPKVKSAPGFIAGYWVDPKGGEGFGFVLFESKEQAVAATPPKAKVERTGSDDCEDRCATRGCGSPLASIPSLGSVAMGCVANGGGICAACGRR
jgi:hypothetical protein